MHSRYLAIVVVLSCLDLLMALPLTKEAENQKERLARSIGPEPILKAPTLSLRSLIGSVEENLVQSAVSVSSLVHQRNSEVPEITFSADHLVEKRKAEEIKAIPLATAVQGHVVLLNTQGTTGQPSVLNQDGKEKEVSSTPIEPLTNQNVLNEKNQGTSHSPLEEKVLLQATKGVSSHLIESATEGTVLLQTTKRVNAQPGNPSHILIDRIAVQPHDGNLSFIPVFQLSAPRSATSTEKPITSTQTLGNSSPKTETSTHSLETVAVTSAPLGSSTTSSSSSQSHSSPSPNDHHESEKTSEPHQSSDKQQGVVNQEHDPSHEATSSSSSTSTESSTSSSTSSSTTTTTTTTTTTKKPTTSEEKIEQLKDAEKKLKEKVAEIEAEPIILTARV